MTELRQDELRPAILPLELMPAVDLPQDQSIFEIAIVTDEHLSSAEGAVTAIRHYTLVFNALLKLRDRWSSAEELRDESGSDLSRSWFRGRIREFAEVLQRVADTDEDIIQTTNDYHHKFRLSPGLILNDRREDPTNMIVAHGISGEIPVFDPEATLQSIQFLDIEYRRKMLGTLFGAFANHPDVQSSTRAAQTRDNMSATNWESELPASEIEDRLYKIERGVVAFVQPEKSEVHTRAGIEATIAYQELSLSMAPSMRRVATGVGSRYYGRFDDELFQEAFLAASTVIIDTGSDPDRIKEKSEYLYKKCVTSAQYKLWAATTNFYMGEKTIDERTFTTARSVTIVQERLAQELGREPSPAEVAEQASDIPREQVEEMMYRMSSSRFPLNLLPNEAIGWYLYRQDYYHVNEFDRKIIDDHTEQMIQQVFAGEILDEREKIVLSLRYGVFSPHLVDMRIRTYNRGGQVASVSKFMYPRTEEEFSAVLRGRLEMGPAAISELTGISKAKVSIIRQGAVNKARESIKPNYDDYL